MSSKENIISSFLTEINNAIDEAKINNKSHMKIINDLKENLENKVKIEFLEKEDDMTRKNMKFLQYLLVMDGIL